jgi:hypothetical protein
MLVHCLQTLIQNRKTGKNGRLDIDRVAKIPSHRVLDFIGGEEMNPEAPCTFTHRQNKPPSSRGSVALGYEL